MKKLLKEVVGAFRAVIREPVEAVTERQFRLVERTMLGFIALMAILIWPYLVEMASKATLAGWLTLGLAGSVFMIGGLAYVIRDLDRYVQELRSQIGGGSEFIGVGKAG